MTEGAPSFAHSAKGGYHTDGAMGFGPTAVSHSPTHSSNTQVCASQNGNQIPPSSPNSTPAGGPHLPRAITQRPSQTGVPHVSRFSRHGNHNVCITSFWVAQRFTAAFTQPPIQPASAAEGLHPTPSQFCQPLPQGRKPSQEQPRTAVLKHCATPNQKPLNLVRDFPIKGKSNQNFQCGVFGWRSGSPLRSHRHQPRRL